LAVLVFAGSLFQTARAATKKEHKANGVEADGWCRRWAVDDRSVLVGWYSCWRSLRCASLSNCFALIMSLMWKGLEPWPRTMFQGQQQSYRLFKVQTQLIFAENYGLVSNLLASSVKNCYRLAVEQDTIKWLLKGLKSVPILNCLHQGKSLDFQDQCQRTLLALCGIWYASCCFFSSACVS